MRTFGRLILGALFALLTAILISAARFVPGFFSAYTPFSKSAVAFLSGISTPFPFAVWEVLLLLAGLFGLYRLIRTIVTRTGFLRWCAGVVCFLSAAVFFFVALWGLNHWAPDLSTRLDMETDTYTRDQLLETTRHLADRAAFYASKVPRDENGNPSVTLSDLCTAAGEAFVPLQSEHPLFSGPTAPVKPLMVPSAFSKLGITGIFVCFTGESCINPQTYPIDLPYVLCHETAHRLTVAAEDEANFCAFLACTASRDPLFLYSGYYCGLVHCLNELYRTDPDTAILLRSGLEGDLNADLQRSSAHYSRFRGPAQEAAETVNDFYLHAFDEVYGIGAYDRAAVLLVAWYLSGGR